MRHVNGVEEKFKAALKLLFLEKKWSIQQKSIFMDCFRGLLRACVGIWERDIWNCLQFYDYRLSPHRTFTVAQHSFQFLEIHFNFISKSCLRKENENQSKQRIKKKKPYRENCQAMNIYFVICKHILLCHWDLHKQISSISWIYISQFPYFV